MLSISILPIIAIASVMLSVIYVTHIRANGDEEDYSHYYDCADEELEVTELQAELDKAVKKVRDHEDYIQGLIWHTKQGQGDQKDPLGLKYRDAKLKYIKLTEAANAIDKKLQAAQAALAMCKPPCGHYYAPYGDGPYSHRWELYPCGEHGRFVCHPYETGHTKSGRECGHKWADCQDEEMRKTHKKEKHVCGLHTFWGCKTVRYSERSKHFFTKPGCGHTVPKCRPGNHTQTRRQCGHLTWNCQPAGNHSLSSCPYRSLDGNSICIYTWWRCKHKSMPAHRHILINLNEI